MRRKGKVAVIGSGSWGTALVKIIHDRERTVNWYVRNSDSIEYIKKHKHNPHYLSYLSLNTDKIQLFNDIESVIAQSDILIFAIPSAFLKALVINVTPEMLSKKFIISAVKGIIPEDDLTISDFFNQKYKVGANAFAIISGPSHAEEIALEKLTYLTIASRRRSRLRKVAKLIECDYIKTIISRDVYGIELAAAMKNIIAIAAGICHSLGYGDNFQAVMVSNAIREIKRFLDRNSRSRRRIESSAYLGDLLVTAYSQFSRNRTLGTMIGKGYNVNAALMEMKMVSEGYYATKGIIQLNKNVKVDMPIIQTVYDVLYEGKSAVKAFEELTHKLH